MSAYETPPRPRPGGFINTPAPQNAQPAPSFGVTPRAPRLVQENASLAIAGSTTVETKSAAERTGESINKILTDIASLNPLELDVVGRTAYNYEIRTGSAWAPFQKYKSHMIPDQIFEQLNRAQVSSNMGLFAEIHHAWVTVDNALYLWDYTQPNPELLGFEDQSYSIETVKLAKPKAGVFLNTIKHMIVLATTDQMMLLGLGEDPASPGSGLTLFQTGMSASVKGLHISHISCSAKTGRVFFGCSTDNDVRELVYQAQDSWFASRCSVANHTQSRFVTNFAGALTIFSAGSSEHTVQTEVDDSRDLLYTLSSTSNIRAFHISPDASTPALKASIGMQRIHRSAEYVMQNGNISDNTRIAAISAIGEAETPSWCLMATTAEGYRIYLGGAFTYTSSSQPSQPKILTELSLSHIRTPPMVALQPGEPALTSFNARNVYLTKVSAAYRFPPGYFFAAIARTDGAASEDLFVSAPDAQLDRGYTGSQQGAPEYAAWIDIKSKVMDIGFTVPYESATRSPRGFAYELAVQYDTPVPEVAVLTNTGVHILRRKRFVDSLSSLIRENGGQEKFQNELQNLIVKYGRQEVLADALAVACGQSMETGSDRAVRINDPQVLEAARKIFIDHGGRPSINQNDITIQAAPIDAVRPSPRYEASVRYLSRLLRSTWKQTIPREDRSPVGYQILSAVPAQKLREVQENLTSLQKFFNNNKSFIRGLSGPDDLAKQASKDDEIALQGEHRAFTALLKFISEMTEAISFVLVLFDEKVAEIVPLLPERSRMEFMTMTFEQLVVSKSGMNVAKDLVKAIVNRNIAKGSNVETIAEALRRKCGNFCSADDVIIFKAQELLKRAAEARANTEACRNNLNESLRLFEQVAKSLPQDYLQSAVKEYLDLQFFAGAIQLVLKVAYESDPINDAQAYVSNGSKPDDVRKAKYDARCSSYNLIHNVLEAIDTTLQSGPTFVDGRPSLSAIRRDEAYEVISHSKDELFLTNLYDWFIEKGWYDRLLNTDSVSGFVVTYLQRRSEQDSSSADLLWQYYGKNSQFHEAAKVQLKLAQTTQYTLTLDRRLGYLSRARANASAFTTANNAANRKSKQKLLTEINNLIDVANIQDEILGKLRGDARFGEDAEKRQRVLDELNGQIQPISDLFNNYADPARYYDICLCIYAIADHRDTAQIKNTWQQLLEVSYENAKLELEAAQQEPDEKIRIELMRDVANVTERVAADFHAAAKRVQISEAVFPVPLLVEMLERFNIKAGQQYAQQAAQIQPGLEHWIPDTFLALEVPFELLYDSLETTYLASNVPDVKASDRRIILSDLLFVVKRWFDATATRAGQTLFGGETGQLRIDDLLLYLSQQTGRQIGEQEVRDAQQLRQRIADLVG